MRCSASRWACWGPPVARPSVGTTSRRSSPRTAPPATTPTARPGGSTSPRCRSSRTTRRTPASGSASTTGWRPARCRRRKADQPDPADRDRFVRQLAAGSRRPRRRRVAAEGRATRRRLNRYEYENALRDLLGAAVAAGAGDAAGGRESPTGSTRSATPSTCRTCRWPATSQAAEFALQRGRRGPGRAAEADGPTRYYARDQQLVHRQDEVHRVQHRARAGHVPGARHGGPAGRAGREGAGDRRGGRPEDPRARGRRAGPAPTSRSSRSSTSSRRPCPAGTGCGSSALGLGRAERVQRQPEEPGQKTSPKWFIPNLDDVSPGPAVRAGDGLRRAAAAAAPAARQRSTSRPSRRRTSSTSTCSRARRSAPTPRGCSARGRRTGRTRSPRRTASPAWRSAGWRSKGRSSTSGRPTGHALLFGDLPPSTDGAGRGRVRRPEARTPSGCCGRSSARAYRRPVPEARGGPLPAAHRGPARSRARRFADAMIAGYTAVLCSPEFLYLDAEPGTARRPRPRRPGCRSSSGTPRPDAELRALADARRTPQARRAPPADRAAARRPAVAPVRRAFLDYWLDLRRSTTTRPDAALYPDYYLDDLLTESALEETRLFFAELLRGNLPARNLVASDFAIRQRAARRALRPAAGRGRGAAAGAAADGQRPRRAADPGQRAEGDGQRHDHLAGPPRGVGHGAHPRACRRRRRRPACRPSSRTLRGATTIREQLAKHRTPGESCAACHAKIDPPGFALESFDVMGGWRDRYRALAEKPDRAPGIGKNGQPFQLPRRACRSTPAANCPTAGRSPTSASSSALLLPTSGRSPATSSGS